MISSEIVTPPRRARAFGGTAISKASLGNSTITINISLFHRLPAKEKINHTIELILENRNTCNFDFIIFFFHLVKT